MQNGSLLGRNEGTGHHYISLTLLLHSWKPGSSSSGPLRKYDEHSPITDHDGQLA
jgi:hypothetical protein